MAVAADDLFFDSHCRIRMYIARDYRDDVSGVVGYGYYNDNALGNHVNGHGAVVLNDIQRINSRLRKKNLPLRSSSLEPIAVLKKL